MLSFESIVVVSVFALFIAFSFRNHDPVTGKHITLGDPTYDVKPAIAPKVDGILLKLFSYVGTQTRFGPSIIRQLLNDNGIVNLRELAAQITLPPLYFPMRRLNPAEMKAYIADIHPNEKSVTEIIKSGISYHGYSQPSYPLGLRSIEEYAFRYRHGVQPSDIIKHTLKTIRDWESKGFRIFSEIKHEEVMRLAKESDERFRHGKPLSIFDGVPVAFKDMMDIEGHHHYNGQNPDEFFSHHWHVSENDDEMVARFRKAGAIILGLTIMSEGGVTPVGYNAHFKGPISAYSWNRYSGGSSSGSAVAVATGLVPVAIGFDGGGSVRLPATMSGLHGLATTFGRCPFRHHLTSTLIKAGPIAATAADAAITYSLISPNEPDHFYTTLYDGGINGPPTPHVSDFHAIENLSGVRIGIFPQWFNDSEPHIRDRAYQVVQFLKSKGVEFVEISIPHLNSIRLAHGIKIGSEFAVGFDKHYHDPASGLEPGTRITVAIGSTSTALESLSGEKLRNYIFQYITKLYATHRLTAIITPSIGLDVPILTEEAKVSGESDTSLSLLIMRHISMVNFVGLPAYTVPIGFLPPQKKHPSEPEGVVLPVGIHLIGNHWSENKLLRLGHAIQEGFTNHLNQPPVSRLFSYDPFANLPRVD